MHWRRVTLVLRALVLCGGAVALPDANAAPLASDAGTPSNVTPSPSVPARSGAPWIGVSMDSGGDTGVRVELILRGSPAERGGIRVGDRIVTIDGVRVTNPGQVTRGVATHKVGESVTVGLERTGSAISANITLAARPSSDDLLRMHLVNAPAPEWSHVTPLSGAPSSLASLRGKVTIIDFWASWCVPCRMIAPRLSALKEWLGRGLFVVGVTTDEAELASAFVERHQMRYPSVVDKGGDTSRAYAINGLPTLVLVDKAGVVRDVFVGFDPGVEARLEATIRRLLAEPAPNPAPR